MKCEDCKWWSIFDPQDIKGGGFCHRFPPVMLGQVLAGTEVTCPESQMEEAQWTVTDYNDWCGEFCSK